MVIILFSMKQPSKVSFIICSYNRAGYLDDTLQSLMDSGLSSQPAELLIIDNNSTDSTPEVVKSYQQQYAKDGNTIRYIKETEQGLSHARNRGIKEAQAPCVVFLDDDIQATEKLISRWVSFFSSNPNALAAGGKIHVQFDDPRPDWMSHYLLPLLGHHDLGDSPRKYPKNKYPFGGNMGFRKNIFDLLGGFNTELGRKGSQLKASEEKEFFRRIRAENIDIYYLPEAKLFHRVNKKRLTEEYIRRQAVGLGESIALQVQNEPNQRTEQIVRELLKIIATFLLFFPYAFTLQLPKALMLIKFRKWIAEGYFGINAQASSA